MKNHSAVVTSAFAGMTALMVALLSFPAPAHAEDTIQQWASNFEKPEVQLKILNRIFPGQLGPLSAAVFNKESGIYIFPKNGSWIQLGKDIVYLSSTTNSAAALVVPCMFYNQLEKGPVSAASYLFYDTLQRPMAISGGYAGREEVASVNLPKLHKNFFVLIDFFGQGNTQQWSAFVMSLAGSDRPHSVWNSPTSARRLQFGFADLGGREEKLVVRVSKGGQMEYSAYSWTGTRFAPDSFASESRLKTLPDSTWQFGTSQ